MKLLPYPASFPRISSFLQLCYILHSCKWDASSAYVMKQPYLSTTLPFPPLVHRWLFPQECENIFTLLRQVALRHGSPFIRSSPRIFARNFRTVVPGFAGTRRIRSSHEFGNRLHF